jgi:hypothetical protein
MTKHSLPILCLAMLSTTAAAQPFPMNEQGDVRWVCAGIGLDERNALAKMETDSNLKLVFAGAKRGEYLANVDVVLIDREGKRPALKFTAKAPICLVQAPAGRYQVDALFRDEKRTAAATVAKDAKQPGMLVFRFPGAE